VKGLHLNYNLLQAMSFEPPSIKIQDTDNADISLFIVKFKIKNQNAKSEF